MILSLNKIKIMEQEEDHESGTQDIEAFEKKLKNHRGTVLEESGSSSSEEIGLEPASGFSNENVKLQTKVKLLIQQLIDKDREIESLRTVLGYAKPDPEETVFEGDFRDKKLMELAKKVRTLQVALESEKNRAARAMEEVNRLREEAFKKDNTKGWSRNTIKEETSVQKPVNYDKQYQDLQSKYTNVKTELKKAKNILKREIGEYDSLDSLSKNETWRGRAQQIEILKSKINDLKRQITKKNEESINPSVGTIKVEGSADERRKEIQTLQENLSRTKEDLEKAKKKMQGSISRMSVLEKENKEMRETHKVQIKTLLDKAENDDRFIVELKSEIDRIRKSKGLKIEPVVNNNKEIAELKWQIANLHQTLHSTQEELNEKIKILELFKNIGQQDGIENEQEYKQKIKDLETEIKRLKDNEKKSGNSEDGKLIKELSVQNARLRSKVNELTEKLSKNTFNS